MADRHRKGVRVGRRSPRRPWWRRRRFWLSGALVVLALAVVTVVRYSLAIAALSDGRAQVVAARQLLTGGLGQLDSARIAQAQADLLRAEDDFSGKSQLLQDGWLAQAASHLPWLSTEVGGAQAMRSAGASGTRLGADIVQVLRDVIPTGAASASSSPLQRLVALAGQHPQELQRAANDVPAFEADLARVPTSHLFGPLEGPRASLLSQGKQLIAGAGPALQLLRAVPTAIGQGSHSYLLLLENPGEERPSGGYIGAVGELTFTDGAITKLTFRDSAYYNPLVKNIPAPPPLAAHLFGKLAWQLGDANWSADFPTAMADVERFYKAATGNSVDGEISVDPVALGYILGVLGPIHVPPYPQVLTSANVLTELNYITNKARPEDPGKVFLPPFGDLITRELFGAPIARMPRLAAALERGAHEKHIVLFFHNPTLESLVTGAGLGGQLSAPISDSLLVDDANLSGTKGDLFVTRTMNLNVTVDANGNATDQLTLTYDNPRVTNPADAALLPNSGAQYRDYLRVYLPETAQLTHLTASVNGAPPSNNAPESITFEFGQQAIAYFFAVPVGGTETITLTYSGPFADISVSPEQYHLAWLKQVNALPWPVDVSVRMPSGKRFRWTASLTADQSWSASD